MKRRKGPFPGLETAGGHLGSLGQLGSNLRAVNYPLTRRLEIVTTPKWLKVGKVVDGRVQWA